MYICIYICLATRGPIHIIRQALPDESFELLRRAYIIYYIYVYTHCLARRGPTLYMSCPTNHLSPHCISRAYIRACVRACVRARVSACVRACARARVRACVRVGGCVCVSLGPGLGLGLLW